ncbi:AAA family ATPase [bacterium]|nr:AAA family ATPase [bacterium]
MTMQTTDRTNTIQQKLNELISSKKTNITTIAKGINKSPSTVSQYLSNNYGGKINELENDLSAYLNLFKKHEAAEVKKLSYIETAVSKRIYNAANLCHIHGKMGACYGAPGVGKTTAIKEYQRINSGVLVVDPLENSSARQVLRQLSEQLKVSYYNSMVLDDVFNNIIKKIENNKHLIILDEAENLKIEVFKVIRKLYDRTNNNCGVLFVGTTELKMLLLKVQSGFPYISSRIGYIEKLDTIKPEDASKLISQYFPNASMELIKFLSKQANLIARNIQNMLDLCLDITKSNNIDLSIDVIEAAKDKLLI